MNNILILYPKPFRCNAKFERKVSKIIANIPSFKVTYQSDDNNLISSYFSKEYSEVKLVCDSKWDKLSITHAIVFDDGREFTKEIDLIKSTGIPVRLIKIKITRVVNIKKDVEYKNIKSTEEYEYIGRGSYWGNPYSMYESGETRDGVIHKYQYDFDRDLFPNKKKSEVYKLAGKKLGCFCKPESCHGDIIANFLNSYDDNK